jgi:TRAP-type mannitol/chloroaromatic compound transport system permease small subunit
MFYSNLERAAGLMAMAMALIGGAVLLALVAMTCVSITGRALVPLNIGLGPVPGDFEWIELGVGFAVFSFLPWCQFTGGHARVDLFQSWFGTRGNAAIDILSNLLMTAAATIIAWRLYLGMADKLRYGETTFILQLPLWQAYAAGLVGAVVFALVAAFCVIRAVAEARE